MICNLQPCMLLVQQRHRDAQLRQRLQARLPRPALAASRRRQQGQARRRRHATLGTPASTACPHLPRQLLLLLLLLPCTRSPSKGVPCPGQHPLQRPAVLVDRCFQSLHRPQQPGQSLVTNAAAGYGHRVPDTLQGWPRGAEEEGEEGGWVGRGGGSRHGVGGGKAGEWAGKAAYGLTEGGRRRQTGKQPACLQLQCCDQRRLQCILLAAACAERHLSEAAAVAQHADVGPHVGCADVARLGCGAGRLGAAAAGQLGVHGNPGGCQQHPCCAPASLLEADVQLQPRWQLQAMR